MRSPDGNAHGGSLSSKQFVRNQENTKYPAKAICPFISSIRPDTGYPVYKKALYPTKYPPRSIKKIRNFLVHEKANMLLFTWKTKDNIVASVKI